jgi:hypothetical protein
MVRGTALSCALLACASAFTAPLGRRTLIRVKPTDAAAFTADIEVVGFNREAGVVIRDTQSPIGLGAYASRAFSEGDVIGEYIGERLTPRQASRRYKTWTLKSPRDVLWILARWVRGVPRTGRYLLNVGDDLVIDAEDLQSSDWTRYVNHANGVTNASLVNIIAVPDEIEGEGTAAIFCAARDIAPGEELCFDYRRSA